MFGVISDNVLLTMMNVYYHRHKYTEAQWMEMVEITIADLVKKNPKNTKLDPDKLRKYYREEWRNFVALSDKQ